MRCLVAFMLTLVISGCSSHEPVQVNLSVNPPGNYLKQLAKEDNGPSVDKWWQAFGDYQLNRLMTELFSQNLELSQAFARLQQAEAIASISRSSRFPSVSAGGTSGRSQQPGLTGDFAGDSQQMSLQASFEIDLWGRLAAQSHAAQLDYVASQEELHHLYLGLSARLADLYFLSIEQRAQIILAEQLASSFSDTAEMVERRYHLGLAPAVDLYQSRQSLSAARASLYLFEARLAEAEHALSVLLGRYPEQIQGGPSATLPEPPVLFSIGIPAGLISSRPDLLAALRRVEAADERVAAAIADRFPSISLTGNYGSLRQEVTAGLITGDFWNLLGSLTLPVVDGGRRRAEVDRNEAALREAVANYQQKVLSAFQDVEDALVNNYATEQRIKQLAETAKATGATLRLSTARYLAGLSDYLPVLSAQRADFDTRSRLLSAQRQLLSDRLSLARALGGSWMRDEVNKRLQLEKESK